MRPLRTAGLTLNEVKELGFRVSSKLWKSCLDDRPRNLGKYLILLFIYLDYWSFYSQVLVTNLSISQV